MAMDAGEIERLIKEGIPDAQVTIRDLAGDGNHYAATVLAASFRANRGCSSINWSIRRSKARWAACCTLWRCRPARREAERLALKTAELTVFWTKRLMAPWGGGRFQATYMFRM